ncbi:hypothetical protein C8R43DRAFT_1140173 [Mycena crocata]|nr:hypothetical protein C8R43DRAFT_1140173 [Mycena crocata]
MAVQVRLYHQRRGRFDERHMQRFWKLGGTPGFTGSLRPGIAVERRAVHREQRAAARQAAREARRTQARAIAEDSSEDGMDVDDEVVVDAAGDGWSADREVDDEWEDEDQEMVPPRPLAPGEDSEEEGEGHKAREEAVLEILHQIAVLAVDDRGEGVDEM